MSGEAGRCQAAAEFLQSLLETISSQTVTLSYPGVARFLLDEGGQSILRQLESRFQCVLELGNVQWSPPDPQVRPALALLLGEAGRRVPAAPSPCCLRVQRLPSVPTAGAGGAAPPELPAAATAPHARLQAPGAA